MMRHEQIEKKVWRNSEERKKEKRNFEKRKKVHGKIWWTECKEKKEEMSDKFTGKIFWTMTLICGFAIWSGIQTLEN